MAETTPKITQIFIKFFDNKTLTLQFPTQFTITPQSISHQIQSLTQIPPQFQTLTLNGKLLSPTTPSKIPNYSTLTLNTPLLGGKGGFGSLLRGAGTKAGQKKTNNFDACRDMSGRRLRHVNADKKLEEWKAGEEERKLEKTAEKYLKDMAKKGKGGKRDDGAEKYVEKYREDSARCVEEVDKSVREAALVGRKRKGVDKVKGGDVDAKKFKIWMGKRKVDDTDSDDSGEDTESDDSDTENEKSAVTDNGSQSDSSKDASNGSVRVPKLAEDHSVKETSDSGSGEENGTLTEGGVETDATANGSNSQSDGDGHMETSSDGEANLSGKPCVSVSADVAATSPQIISDQLPHSSTLVKVGDEVPEDSVCKSAFPDEAVNVSPNVVEVSQPLNFDDFNSSSELEILGMERLKTELQERGLKCGGTLQERAARLFLLKTTPLEKLPKKLLAKK
ncbi:hypothetical protein RND81_03G220800 [Saponaria officinalis]|uniref:Sde2 N-terminal ubiquitin domain-containing protein n=1 Tax=Saponaria officinalis TaxID=3572 RepID=A0AAW1MBG9_SAPOF